MMTVKTGGVPGTILGDFAHIIAEFYNNLVSIIASHFK